MKSALSRELRKELSFKSGQQLSNEVNKIDVDYGSLTKYIKEHVTNGARGFQEMLAPSKLSILNDEYGNMARSKMVSFCFTIVVILTWQ